MGKRLDFDWVKRADGTSEFEDFLDALPIKDAAKLLAVIHNTEIEGILIAIKMKWVKKLEDDLYELRSKQGSDIQRAIYFHEIENKYIITHGFTKKTDATPESEKVHARNVRQGYKAKKRGEKNE